MQKVLITGGCGFLGKNIFDHLRQQGLDVHILDLLSLQAAQSTLPSLKAEQYIQHDLIQLEGLEGLLGTFDTVIHLAAISDTRESETEPLVDLEISTKIAWHVVLAMQNIVKPQRLIFTSSQHVYGPLDPSQRHLTEDAPKRPSSLYGAGKVAAEAIMSVGSHHANLDVIILRLTNIVGCHQSYGVLPDFLRKLDQNPNQLDVLGNGAAERNFLHVSDLCQAIALIMSLETSNHLKIFNVASEETISIGQLAELVLDELGLDNLPIKFESELPNGWQGDPGSILPDTGRLQSIGWQANWDCETAIRKAIQDLKDTYIK